MWRVAPAACAQLICCGWPSVKKRHGNSIFAVYDERGHSEIIAFPQHDIDISMMNGFLHRHFVNAFTTIPNYRAS